MKTLEFFSKLFEERKEEVMTIADQLREQGREQGMLEGIEKGRLTEREEVARNLLMQGLDISIIENATGFSRKDLAKIQKNIRTTH